MPILGNTNLFVSPIGLGTVEIGLPYGIGRQSLPSYAEAEYILKTAVDLGITYFDTARGYGVAEERIGKSGISQSEGVIVGTKCGQFLKDEPNLHGQELKKRIRDEVNLSRRNLKLETLPLLQLHIESPDFDNLDELLEIIRQLQEEQKIQHLGLACRGEKVPLAAMQMLDNQSNGWRRGKASGPRNIKHEVRLWPQGRNGATATGPVATPFFSTIQTAYNILDQRMAAKVLPQAKKQNIGIICRSVLLQGALTSAVKKLPDKLSLLKSNSQKATQIAAELGLDLPTLAIRFASSHPAISTTLIGTTKPQHLKTALAATQTGPLPKDVLPKLAKLAINDPSQIDPSQWPKTQTTHSASPVK